MYILGHVGVTVTAARAADRDIDLRAAAFLALLPDIIDKPLRWVIPRLVHHNSRSFGHTLLAWIVVAAALAAWRSRPGRGWVLWACFAVHAVLDRLWLGHNPSVFLWPFLGPFPPPVRAGPAFDREFLYDLAGEALGFALLMALAIRHRLFDRPQLERLLTTGRA